MRCCSLPLVLPALLIAALGLTASACGTSSTSTTTPTTPTPATTTETFSGVVTLGGSDAHPFTVSAAGTVTIGLTAVSPLTTMALGLAVASWDATSSTCGTATVKNDNARAGATALTGIASASSYCVRVYDSGNVPEGWEVSYTVDVVHP